MLRQLCDDLRLLRLQAGGPSLRGLAARLRLGKSQVGSILNGRISHLPAWEVVRGIVDGCHQYALEHGRLDQLSLATGIEQFWRPRYATVDHALQQAARQQAGRQPPDPAPPPRQLPAAARHFAGRAEPLDALNGLLHATDRTSAVMIAAITGTAGVGKTALAVHWAHQVADRFPDGQLHVNLRGFGPAGPVLDPGDVVRRFLDSLGVPVHGIPADADALAALYRSTLAGRRILILLDNARDGAQVRPLLPGTPGCLVLVTSREPLTSLVAAEQAHPVPLGLLAPDEAEDLLARRLGRARIAAEPVAVKEIISHCARLPLALAIAAARAATGRVPLPELAAQLRDPDHRLGLLNAGDPTTDIRAVFAWSYLALTPPAARMFRLLGRHPGPDTTPAALAGFTAAPVPEVRRLLAELVRANLLTEPAPGRYACHDLLRAYAQDLGDDSDGSAATARLLDHYLHTAGAADRLLYPDRDPVVLGPPEPGSAPQHLADRQQALEWLAAEHIVLLSTVDHAADRGYDRHTWQLAWTLTGFLERHRRWSDLAAVAELAVAAAGRQADPHASALAHRALARAHIEIGRYGDARANLGAALDLATRAGDRLGQAHTHHHLAYLWEHQRGYARALGHTRQALMLYRAADHRRGQAAALNAVGWYHAQLGDHATALTACRQALALLEELNHRPGQAATWDSIGYAYHHLGDHAHAAGCFRQALTLCRDLGERYQEATTLTHLGDSHQAAGRLRAARTAWRRALTILAELDHPDADLIRAKLHVSRRP